MKKARILFCASLGFIFLASDIFAVMFGEASAFRVLTGLLNAAVFVVIGWSGFGLGAAFAKAQVIYNNRNLLSWSLVSWLLASLLFRFTYEPQGSIVFAILPPLVVVFVMAALAGKGPSASDRET